MRFQETGWQAPNSKLQHPEKHENFKLQRKSSETSLPQDLFRVGRLAKARFSCLVGQGPDLNLTVFFLGSTWVDWLLRFAVKRRRVSEPERNREAEQLRRPPLRVFFLFQCPVYAARLWTVSGNL
jgi:hypothetical protein